MLYFIAAVRLFVVSAEERDFACGKLLDSLKVLFYIIFFFEMCSIK